MALTITNTNTITLLNILNKNSAAQSNTLLQLTTGKRINSGKDDPAGLIALANLNADNASITRPRHRHWFSSAGQARFAGCASQAQDRTDSNLKKLDLFPGA